MGTYDFIQYELFVLALDEKTLSPPTRNSTELVAELFTMYIHQQYLHQQFYMTFNNSDTLYFGRQMDERYMRGVLE